MRNILTKTLLCLLMSFSFIVSSCSDSSRSRKRNIELLTPGQGGGICPSQVSADISVMNDICNVQGYNWQKHDIFVNCFEEVNSLRINYPKLDCKFEGTAQTIEALDALYEKTKKRIYQYKTGMCGSETILSYNELFDEYDPQDQDSRTKLARDLDHYADRYPGINCETTEIQIKVSSRPTKIKLTRELINKIRESILKKKASKLQSASLLEEKSFNF